jgi:hypothetical protein
MTFLVVPTAVPRLSVVPTAALFVLVIPTAAPLLLVIPTVAKRREESQASERRDPARQTLGMTAYPYRRSNSRM